MHVEPYAFETSAVRDCYGVKAPEGLFQDKYVSVPSGWDGLGWTQRMPGHSVGTEKNACLCWDPKPGPSAFSNHLLVAIGLYRCAHVWRYEKKQDSRLPYTLQSNCLKA
jgi:hypothetical protein